MSERIPYQTCNHGAHRSEPCDACLIHWSEHCIESSRQNIAKHERKIAEIRARIEAARTIHPEQHNG